MKSRILFITWDGPQTQYLGRLFLPVFRELAAEGYMISILQFSPFGRAEREKVRKQCQAVGVHYVGLYASRGFGIFGALLAIVRGGLWLSSRNLFRHFDVVIVRSIIPSLVYLLSLGRKRTPLVYDADGLPVEQRLEFEGVRQGGILHRLLLFIERQTLGASVSIVSRSKFGSRILKSRVSGELNHKHFFEHNNGVGSISNELNSSREMGPFFDKRSLFAVAYVGSWGAQYRPQEMLELVLALRERIPSTVFSIYSGDLDAVESDLRSRNLLASDWITVQQLNYVDLHNVLMMHHLGLALRSRSETAKAVYPLKLADYLFAGLPVVGDIVADMEPALVDSGVFRDTDGRSLEETVEWCESIWRGDRSSIRHACVSLASRLYRLDRTVDVYRSAIDHARYSPKGFQGVLSQ